MKRRRRVIIRVVVFLMLGAIVDVGVAWGCVCWSPMSRIERLAHDHESFPDRLAIKWPEPREVRDRGGVGMSSHSMWHSSEYPFRMYEYSSLQCGWPMRAFHKESIVAIGEGDGVMTERFIVARLRDLKWLSSFEYRELPALPIWPGFAINTIFYAAILWVLWATPFAVRKWRRIKRGRCANCGYDITGAPHTNCPECGTPASSPVTPGRIAPISPSASVNTIA
jgi:hypothetical protein